jgi:HEAT repeat protein
MDDVKVFGLVDQLLTDDEHEIDRVRKELVALGCDAIPALVQAALRSRAQYKELQEEALRISSDLALWSEQKIAEIDRKKALVWLIEPYIGGILGSLGVPAIPHLIPLFRDEQLRKCASSALRAIGKPILADVRPFLHDRDPAVRGATIGILASLRTDACEAYGEIEGLINDPVFAVRKEAIEAVAEINGVRSLPVLKKQWVNADSRRAVLTAYSAISAPLMGMPSMLEKVAQEVIDDLISALDEDELYSAVAYTLTYMAPAPSTRKAIPALINALRFDPEDADSIGRALSHMQTAAAWPTAEALLHRDERIRKGAGRVLWYFTWSGMCDDGVDAEQVYLRRLPSRNRDERLVACLALKTMGPSHRAAEPIKILLLKEEDQEVWDAANAALKSIKPL